MGSPGLQVCDIAPLDPAGVGQYQRRAVGGVTGPSVPHTTDSLPKLLFFVKNIIRNDF